MAKTYVAGQDYTFVADGTNKNNDVHQKLRDAQFGYTVDDEPI